MLVTIKLPAEKVYKVVRTALNTPEELLEQIFHEFNPDSGQKCKEYTNGRGLSTNDFVCLDTQWYQCESTGWKTVTPAFVEEIEKKVRAHPEFSISPWVALDRVMYAQRHAVDPFDL